MILGAGKWNEQAWRRAVIDMHIPDWDPKFLSRFDAEQYAGLLVKSRAQSIVAYVQSHVGLFNYPTKIGHPHGGLNGRNMVQEVLDACHRRNIAVVLYCSLIFDRWAADNHRDWRMVSWDGKAQGEGGRHGTLCVNSPYRDYVRRFTEEICSLFDFDGIRFDMTFWPGHCYCAHCRQRFAAEVGGEIPTTVNWLDEKWVAFQRCRERWLVEFASIPTETVRRMRPRATVEHQSSTYPLDWVFGVTAPLTKQNDFLQGDFYGDALQGSFVRKLLEDLSPARPIAFETSAMVELHDHTTLKSEALLEAKACAAIADHAAFVFIDAINPIGTVNPHPHERMGRVWSRLMPYYAHLGGERVADIGVYYSPESKFSFAGNGRHVSNPDRANAHTDSVIGVCRALLAAHLPFRIVTKGSLERLRELKTLVLSNVNMMDKEEAAAIQQWVRGGGTLYASGGTSLVDKAGRKQSDFLLADLFGVTAGKADWQPRERYVSPTAAGKRYFVDYDSEYPAFVTGYGIEVIGRPGAEVLATTTLPWPAPNATQFSSIHSNPPWVPTDRPEIVMNRAGKGRVVYSASVLETVPGLSATLTRLLKMLCGPTRLEVEAPACVEATLFHQPDRHRYVLTLANFQKDLPNLPVEEIKVRLRLPNERVHRVTQLPSGHAVAHSEPSGQVAFKAPRLELIEMFAVEVA